MGFRSSAHAMLRGSISPDGGQVAERFGALLASTEHQRRRWVPQHPLLPARPLRPR